MTQPELIAILLALVAVLFAIVVMMLGWMGNKVYGKLGELANSMHRIESEVHGRISELDRRVTRVETKCGLPIATPT